MSLQHMTLRLSNSTIKLFLLIMRHYWTKKRRTLKGVGERERNRERERGREGGSTNHAQMRIRKTAREREKKTERRRQKAAEAERKLMN